MYIKDHRFIILVSFWTGFKSAEARLDPGIEILKDVIFLGFLYLFSKKKIFFEHVKKFNLERTDRLIAREKDWSFKLGDHGL